MRPIKFWCFFRRILYLVLLLTIFFLCYDWTVTNNVISNNAGKKSMLKFDNNLKNYLNIKTSNLSENLRQPHIEKKKIFLNSGKAKPNQTKSTTEITETKLDKDKKRNFTETSVWQSVDDSKDLFVFSAYFYEPENSIRIIGIGLRDKLFDIQCIFKDNNGERESEPVCGNVSEIEENHQKSYTAVFVLCPLSGTKNRPYVVSVSTRKSTSEPRNIMTIAYTDAVSETNDISVCIPPLHSQYSNINEFIQTVEMNLILGASKIYIYNEESSASVQQVLNYYKQKGLTDIIVWKLPVDNKLIHYHGQMAFIHDCWLRNRNIFKFVAFNDLDELIIPYKHKNWHQLLSFYLSKNSKTGSFMFLNSYFIIKTKNDFKGLGANERKAIREMNLHTMATVWREDYIWKYNHRSKYILMPRRVTSIGIHRVYGYGEGFKEVVVDPKIALLHQYKGGSMRKCSMVRDDSVRKYSRELIKNVRAVYQTLKATCTNKDNCKRFSFDKHLKYLSASTKIIARHFRFKNI